MTSDLPARIGRDQDWDRWSGCVSLPLFFPPFRLAPAAFDRNPSPPHQGEGENALRPRSSSPPCWAADGQLSTPHRSCGEDLEWGVKINPFLDSSPDLWSPVFVTQSPSSALFFCCNKRKPFFPLWVSSLLLGPHTHLWLRHCVQPCVTLGNHFVSLSEIFCSWSPGERPALIYRNFTGTG